MNEYCVQTSQTLIDKNDRSKSEQERNLRRTFLAHPSVRISFVLPLFSLSPFFLSFVFPLLFVISLLLLLFIPTHFHHPNPFSFHHPSPSPHPPLSLLLSHSLISFHPPYTFSLFPSPSYPASLFFNSLFLSLPSSHSSLPLFFPLFLSYLCYSLLLPLSLTLLSPLPNLLPLFPLNLFFPSPYPFPSRSSSPSSPSPSSLTLFPSPLPLPFPHLPPPFSPPLSLSLLPYLNLSVIWSCLNKFSR